MSDFEAFLPLLGVFAVLFGYLGWMVRQDMILKAFLTDVQRPEERRRAELIAHLGGRGFTIVFQDKAMVQVQKKPAFSFIIFLLLCCIYAVPGILYLIWYATAKPTIKTFILEA